MNSSQGNAAADFSMILRRRGWSACSHFFAIAIFGWMVFCQSPSVVAQSQKSASAEQLTRDLQQLKQEALRLAERIHKLETEIQQLRAKATEARTAAMLQTPPSPRHGLTRVPPEVKSEATNSFLDFLIILSFIGFVASVVYASWRDRNLPPASEDPAAAEAAAPPAYSVYFQREGDDRRPEKTDDPTSHKDSSSESASENEPSSASQTVETPEVFEPSLSEKLRVEPKKPHLNKNSQDS